MDERNELELALLAESCKLAELRALRERVRQRRLEDDDWAVVSALAAEAIEQAEPGQEWVTLEVSEEEKSLAEQTAERSASRTRRPSRNDEEYASDGSGHPRNADRATESAASLR